MTQNPDTARDGIRVMDQEASIGFRDSQTEKSKQQGSVSGIARCFTINN
jgi:hypothetical protein